MHSLQMLKDDDDDDDDDDGDDNQEEDEDESEAEESVRRGAASKKRKGPGDAKQKKKPMLKVETEARCANGGCTRCSFGWILRFLAASQHPFLSDTRFRCRVHVFLMSLSAGHPNGRLHAATGAAHKANAAAAEQGTHERSAAC